MGETADPIKRGSARSAAIIQTAIPMGYRERNREGKVFSILDFLLEG
jgi:hypothetical protein